MCVISVGVCGLDKWGRVHMVSTQILSESIMYECTIRLLKSASDEESLEGFAMLMTTTGKDLDKEEAKVCGVSNG